MVSILRLVRTIRQQSLADVCRATGIKRGWLSTCERDTSEAGPKLRAKIAAFYGLPWETLAKYTDPNALASRFIDNLRPKETN